jgi:hypothetical protein
MREGVLAKRKPPTAFRRFVGLTRLEESDSGSVEVPRVLCRGATKGSWSLAWGWGGVAEVGMSSGVSQASHCGKMLCPVESCEGEDCQRLQSLMSTVPYVESVGQCHCPRKEAQSRRQLTHKSHSPKIEILSDIIFPLRPQLLQFEASVSEPLPGSAIPAQLWRKFSVVVPGEHLDPLLDLESRGNPFR